MGFIAAAQAIALTKPVPARATGYFHELPAPAFLCGTFSSTWIHRMPETSAPPVIVTPDGTIDLQWIDRTFRVAGPDKDPMIENLPAGTTVVGFRFQPAAAATWLGVSANQIVGQRLSLQELWGPRARGIAGKVRDHQNIAELIAALESAMGDFSKNAPTNEPMRAAYNLILAGPPPGVALVPWLGRTLAMSERTLRRRFDESFGYGPKTLDRILRYQRFLSMVRLSPGSAAILAVEAGYSDQPHLVRESRRLAGCTPLEVERTMRTGGSRD